MYEHLVFEGSHHKSLRTFPGMADRTVRVGSAGKTFSFTAWKVCLAPECPCRPRGVGAMQLCAPCMKHPCITFSMAGSLQHAVACGLDLDHTIVATHCLAECGHLPQIGWVTGPAPLVSAVGKAHQFVTFTVASSLQRAVAYGLDNEAVFYTCACTIAAPAPKIPVH